MLENDIRLHIVNLCRQCKYMLKIGLNNEVEMDVLFYLVKSVIELNLEKGVHRSLRKRNSMCAKHIK